MYDLILPTATIHLLIAIANAMTEYFKLRQLHKDQLTLSLLTFAGVNFILGRFVYTDDNGVLVATKQLVEPTYLFTNENSTTCPKHYGESSYEIYC